MAVMTGEPNLAEDRAADNLIGRFHRFGRFGVEMLPNGRRQVL